MNKNPEEFEALRRESETEYQKEADRKNLRREEDEPEVTSRDIAHESAETEDEVRNKYQQLINNFDAELQRFRGDISPSQMELEGAINSVLNLKLMDPDFEIDTKKLEQLVDVMEQAGHAPGDDVEGSPEWRTLAKGFQGWSHTVCHLYESYGRDKTYSGSFLNSPDTLPAGKSLMSEAVRRAAAVGTSGCLDRITQPVIKYNLDNLPDDVNAPFAFYPEMDEETKQQYAKETWRAYSPSDESKLFLSNDTPKQFILEALKKNPAVIVEAGTRLVPYLKAIENELGPEEAAKLIPETLRRDNGITSLEQLAQNLETATGEHQEMAPKATYVDVDGTLIVDGKLYRSTVEKIKRSSMPVVIFSGGDPNEQTERLRKLGCPEEYLPVISKNDFRGKKLQGVLIDDTPPDFQGFSSDKYQSPRAHFEKPFMEHWADGD